MKRFSNIKYPLTKTVLVCTVFYILFSLAKVVGEFTYDAGLWLSVLTYILFVIESH